MKTSWQSQNSFSLKQDRATDGLIQRILRNNQIPEAEQIKTIPYAAAFCEHMVIPIAEEQLGICFIGHTFCYSSS